jgi:glycerophosphoryl diester phosphodiesterase
MLRSNIASAVIVAAIITPTSAEAATALTLIGHRGTATTLSYVENSKGSVKAAMVGGARGVEVDVRLTKDKQIIAMHDKTLDRTTTCTGAVASRTYDDIRKNCKLKLTGEKVPNLYELAWTYSKYDSKGDRLWVHTKFESSSKVRSSVMRALDKYGLRKQAVIFADEDQWLDDWRKWSGIERALIFNQTDVDQGGKESWESGFDYVVPYMVEEVTAKLVSKARAKGSKVYGVDTPTMSREDAERLELDGFLANTVA